MTTSQAAAKPEVEKPVHKALTKDYSERTLWYRAFKHVLIGPALNLLCPSTVEGVENIPSSGGALIAYNHLSATDWLFVPLAVPRKVTHVAKSEYFTGTGIKGAFQRWFFSSAGQVPIDRSGGDASRAALESLKKVLAKGNLAAIFPEGTRSPDGRLYKGKTGAARIVLEAKVPVIPVGVIGTDKVLAPDSAKFHPHPVTVRIGKPLDFSRFYDFVGNHYVERSIADEIMYEIMRLSGQEYVDAYATRKKRSGGEKGSGPKTTPSAA
ncbi:1-acylglycerol-3-phosphate O-acyltransferase [Segniliparus rugosus ATCC BAA-974]|uniref:1-acylglycerol-3-phosphate O-acyltransferase n=1 Tax=Segniliparus rugosus (strain ATCC BAA-974 / DSM 45345 / CCUG 50838 / CIP 108380 / JCM 13579 / CDC 945) TaxID=679197 RepID=E5XMN3_SEGRC|nr:1-acylglycerol-3-phosphate O-acyltransferase [Segniliparus rugosus ATCC BAA-974]